MVPSWWRNRSHAARGQWWSMLEKVTPGQTRSTAPPPTTRYATWTPPGRLRVANLGNVHPHHPVEVPAVGDAPQLVLARAREHDAAPGGVIEGASPCDTRCTIAGRLSRSSRRASRRSAYLHLLPTAIRAASRPAPRARNLPNQPQLRATRETKPDHPDEGPKAEIAFRGCGHVASDQASSDLPAWRVGSEPGMQGDSDRRRITGLSIPPRVRAARSNLWDDLELLDRGDRAARGLGRLLAELGCHFSTGHEIRPRFRKG